MRKVKAPSIKISRYVILSGFHRSFLAHRHLSSSLHSVPRMDFEESRHEIRVVFKPTLKEVRILLAPGSLFVDIILDMKRRHQTLPEETIEVLYWRINDRPRWILLINVLSVILFFFWFFVFGWVAGSIGKFPKTLEITFNFNLVFPLVGCALILGLHELVHGFVMWLLGARPQYGVLREQMMFYATSPGYPFTRAQYLAVILGPFILISLAAILLIMLIPDSSWILLIVLLAAINASGAIGDQWMSVIVLRYPSTAYVMDERDGMRVFLPKKE